MNFFKNLWVEIVAVVMFVLSILMLALAGFTQAEISPLIDGTFVVLDCISLLILAIKKLLQKKDTTNK